jgi:hypothetical protein
VTYLFGFRRITLQNANWRGFRNDAFSSSRETVTSLVLTPAAAMAGVIVADLGGINKHGKGWEVGPHLTWSWYSMTK